jgi:deglycase
VKVDRNLERTRPGESDALLLPRGVMNPDNSAQIPKPRSSWESVFDAGKPVAAICHGPG